MNTKAEWTWLVYMAGDNNLEGAGRSDLVEMKRVGSTPDVNVIVQFDTEANATTRYKVAKSKLQVLKSMPGVNCGDPRILTDFLQWGMREYPARRYLVNVWNHGGGWENLPADYDYDAVRAAKPRRAAKLTQLRRSLFRTTAEKIHARSVEDRAIALDCGSRDYLDNQELRTALSEALPAGSKFDVLACDACLMNMFEIAYEMKDTADVMVGSEETEPGAGWPYADILKELVEQPSMSGPDLCAIVVDKYGQYYAKRRMAATQSSLNLKCASRLAKAIDALADAMLADVHTIAGTICLARDKAQRFEVPEYMDLGDFACQLLARLPQESPIRDAASGVLSALDSKSASGFVLANVACGASVKRATGVSIYFPRQEAYSPDYRDLAFSHDGQWRKFLEAFFKL